MPAISHRPAGAEVVGDKDDDVESAPRKLGQSGARTLRDLWRVDGTEGEAGQVPLCEAGEQPDDALDEREDGDGQYETPSHSRIVGPPATAGQHAPDGVALAREPRS